MSLGHLIVDGTDMIEHGVWLNGSGAYNAATRDVTTVKVPGRNGDLIFDNGRYENVTIEYPCFIRRNALKGEAFLHMRKALSFLHGYVRIEDTYRPDGYRMGRIIDGINPSTIVWTQDAVFFTLKFDCKPQFFLFDGEIETEVTSSKVFKNDVAYASPLFRVYGYGYFQVVCNGTPYFVHVEDPSPLAPEYIEIDFETGDASDGGINNLNRYVSLVNPGQDFPLIEEGFTVSFGTGSGNAITKIGVTPRWWVV